MHSIAIANHLWDGKGKLDFTKTFSDGEYAHKYYSGRRFWGAMRLVAPSLNLSATYGNLKEDNPYPWSVKPDKPITTTDVFKIHRDHYDNTPYDTAVGLAAGPYGNVDRWKIGSQNQDLKGSWERTITLFRTSYSFVNQGRPSGKQGVSWFGPHAAHGTVYVPLISNADRLPVCLSTGAPTFVDRGTSWWAHRWLINQAHLAYNRYQPIISAEQTAWEAKGQKLVDAAHGMTPANIAGMMDKHATAVMKAWWALSDHLMVKFADGFLDRGEPFGYSDDYLKSVGFQNGPPPIPPTAGATLHD